MSAIVFVPGHARAEVLLPATADPPPSVVAKLHRGRTAIGRIVTRHGEPIAGAALLATSVEPDLWIRERIWASTAKDGTFRIEGLEPKTRHMLVIRHDECERLRVPFPSDEFVAMEINLGGIQVGRGALVTGCVVDESGAAIPGAGIALEDEVPRAASAKSKPEARRLACDGSGNFEFAGVAAGRISLRAGARGFVRAAELELDMNDEEIVDVGDLVVPSGLSIGGVVTDARGRPVPRAHVVLSRVVPEEEKWKSRISAQDADAEGCFRFAGIEPGSYALSATASGREEGAELLGEGSIPRIEAGTTDAVIVLADMSLVTGRVVDASGRPVGGVTLSLVNVGNKRVILGGSDAKGEFRFSVPPDSEFKLEARIWDPSHPGRALNQPVDACVEGIFSGAEMVVLTLPRD